MPLTLESPGAVAAPEAERIPLASEAAPKPQAERIRQAVQRSYRNRNAFTEKTAAKVTDVLQRAEKEVKAALLHYSTLGDLTEGKVANQRSLRRLDGEIRAIIAQVRDEHRLILKGAGKEGFKRGLAHGIGEFAAAQLPFYKDLGPDGINKMSTNVFTIVDTSALDFMTRFNIQLAGDVSRELADGINRTIQTGIATGMSVKDIVKEMGAVVTDQEEFRHAGKKVFGKAQTRMELIARTETMRAHSQGQRKFYATVGVQKLEWLTMQDERMCPECAALDGKVYPVDQFPNQPLHPACRCGHVAVVDMPICGAGSLASEAADAPGCILSPQDVEAEAEAVKADVQAVNTALDTGSFESLTVKQLQTAAKKQGIAIARTKSDFLKLLDQAKPGVDHSALAGQALKDKLAQYQIGALRTKQELTDLLKAKHKAAVQEESLQAMTPPAGGYDQFTVKQLQEMALQKGVSLHMTKQDVIDYLDKVEPGVDHSTLSGPSLVQAKEKFGVGALKNKQQLVDALNKSAGQEAAEQAKKQTEQAELAAKVAQAQTDLAAKTAAVQIPDDPMQYGKFLESVKAAENQVAQSGIVPKDVLDAHAKEVALKKQVFQDKIAVLPNADVKKLAQKTQIKHYQWASKGELVTLLTETDAAKVQAAKDGIEAKWAKWAEKHGSKKTKTSEGPPTKLAPAPPPAPAPKAQPPSAPPTQAPVFAKKGSEFETADAAWQEKGQPTNFKFQGKADIEGAHTKYFYTDEKGEKWLFKPVPEEFRAHGDEVAYRIGRLIDPEAIEVRVIALDGRVGSIQQWRTGLAKQKDFAGLDPNDLSPRDIEQLQREHVIDWLISNHDGHGKQFLRMQDGHVHGIDKGQLFKFLGDDRLSLDYHPNQAHGESEPYYNTLFRAVKDGKVKADPAVTLRYVREVEKISDADYRAILAPYAERRFGDKAAQKEAFYQAALERKNNIRRDFEKFYGDVLGQKDFRFEAAEPEPSKVGRLTKTEVGILAEVRKAGWQGKVIPFDVEDVEDQNALVFVETAGGGPRTVVRLKIRPDAESKMLRNLALTSDDRLVVQVGDTLPQDVFHDKLLGGIKTVNTHVEKGDFAYNQEKLDAIKDMVPDLEKLQKSKDPDVAAMATKYLAECQKVLDGATNKTKYEGKFAPYKKQFQSQPDEKKPAEGITARKTKVRMPLRELKNGEISVAQENAATSDVFGHAMKDGVQYEITLGDGMTASYRPWVSANYYAHQGEMEIRVPGNPDPETFEKMMAQLDRMGITATVATPQDAELMYLHKQAYILKEDTSAAYRKMTQDLDKRSASKEERISRMRQYWEQRLGVPDVTKLQGYNPLGEYQAQWNDPKSRAGYRHQMRFDISDEELDRKMAGFGLYHRLTDDSSVPKFLDEVLRHNGAMASTVEKMRIGVKPGGMSPTEDMNSGGATYFFTRIRKLPGEAGGSHEPGLYFSKRMLRRMDAITYDRDRYGRVNDDSVRTKRFSTVEDWKRIGSRRGSDETIFKYSVTLLDNIDRIAVRNETEKAKIVQVFKKHGIERLPDGRRVEEVVVTP